MYRAHDAKKLAIALKTLLPLTEEEEEAEDSFPGLKALVEIVDLHISSVGLISPPPSWQVVIIAREEKGGKARDDI